MKKIASIIYDMYVTLYLTLHDTGYHSSEIKYDMGLFGKELSQEEHAIKDILKTGEFL